MELYLAEVKPTKHGRDVEARYLKPLLSEKPFMALRPFVTISSKTLQKKSTPAPCSANITFYVDGNCNEITETIKGCSAFFSINSVEL